MAGGGGARSASMVFKKTIDGVRPRTTATTFAAVGHDAQVVAICQGGTMQRRLAWLFAMRTRAMSQAVVMLEVPDPDSSVQNTFRFAHCKFLETSDALFSASVCPMSPSLFF